MGVMRDKLKRSVRPGQSRNRTITGVEQLSDRFRLPSSLQMPNRKSLVALIALATLAPLSGATAQSDVCAPTRNMKAAGTTGPVTPAEA